MNRFLLVCLGGAIGSGARYLTVLVATRYLGIGFPYGTFVVNVVGSFAIAMVVQMVAPSELRFFLVSGVLGGFTTYSSFNEETLLFLRNGNVSLAFVYLALTVLGCLGAGLLAVHLSSFRQA